MMDGFYLKITMMGKKQKSIMNRIYFEALMVTNKIGKRIRLYIFSFCFLIFLFFSLRGYEIFLFWVSCFCFCKITVFITGNAPLILKILITKLIFIFFVYVSCFFFLLCAFIYNYIVKFSEQHLPFQISFIDLFLLLSCQS